MSAAAVLRQAREAGLEIEAEGDDLLVDFEGPTPSDLLGLLRNHKAEILLLLRREQDAWTAEDWRAYWGERAGIAEFDGGLSREQAEAQAWAACVVEWLNQHPARSDPRWCAHCGRTDDMGEPLVPAGIAPEVAWLHPECWGVWHERRQVAAGRALREVGLAALASRP